MNFLSARILAAATAFSLCIFVPSAKAWTAAAPLIHNAMKKSSNLPASTRMSPSSADEYQDSRLDTIQSDKYRTSYLRRIGFTEEEVKGLTVGPPSLESLQTLLTAHLHTIPFENLDQHEHPPHGDTPLIPRRKKLPSLDVIRSLDKIIYQNRGGFCFELNFSFQWLLSSLGYSTRLALADVACNQPVPGHAIILVDDLLDVPVLVDVGFGNPGVCNVLLPVQCRAPENDTHGDLFEFRADDGTDRFDTQLCRTRTSTSSKDTEELMYRFRIDDDMEMTAAEFYDGLDRVLTTSPTFTGKRICVLSDTGGHITLGKDYIKWVESGESVRRIELPTETMWRAALDEYFGIILVEEE